MKDFKKKLAYFAVRNGLALASYFGIIPVPAKPLDLRCKVNNPIEAYYLSGWLPVLIEIDITRLRGFFNNAFFCHRESSNPFIQTLLEYEYKRVNSYQNSALQKFYDSWQPKNAAESLGLPPHNSSTILQQTDAKAAVLPWETILPEARMESRNREMRIQKRKAFMRGKKAELHWHLMGPASSEAGQLEFERLLKIYYSIKKRGYIRSSKPDGDICGYLLLDQEKWCILVYGGGQHRVSALSALFYNKIPIRLFYQKPSIVRREDVAHWPHVRSSLFTKGQALIIFDQIMEARQPLIESQRFFSDTRIEN